MVVYSPLPQQGDEVRLAQANVEEELSTADEKIGTVLDFSVKEGRYIVTFSGEQEEEDEALEPDAIEITKQNEITSLESVEGNGDRIFHILIPCHIDSDRRLVTFMRCVKSVMAQTFYGFNVFVSLSGPEEYCKRAKYFIFRAATVHGGARWHMIDTGLERKAQMEHIRDMLTLSVEINDEAWIMFLDNDDMFHPMRLEVFQQAADGMDIPDGAPFPLGCKLLLREDIAPDEGTLERLVAHTRDFEKWSHDEGLVGKVELAVTSQCDALDAAEYFDYMVPTSIMEKFFRLHPPTLTCHAYCDLRLLRILETLSPIEADDHPEFTWLVAHYKTTMDSKFRAFDDHGGNDDDVSVAVPQDQISARIDIPSASDVALAERYGTLTAAQVRICRQHLESVAIQFIGWDDTKLSEARQDKTRELNGLHGASFGDDLWSEVEEELLSLIPNALVEESKGAWMCLFPTE